MRILLDEQLPRQLIREFPDHDVWTVQQQGWRGVENGELLQRAADENFQVFITKDQNLEFQQNLQEAKLGIIVLDAPSHDIEVLKPLIPATLEAIEVVKPGELRHVAV